MGGCSVERNALGRLRQKVLQLAAHGWVVCLAQVISHLQAVTRGSSRIAVSLHHSISPGRSS